MSQNGMIIVRIGEGLGNQLFQYAFARAWKEKGFNVRLDVDKTYDDCFGKFKNNDPRKNSIDKLNTTLTTIKVEQYGKYAYIKRKNMWDKIVFSLASHKLWKYKFYEEKVQERIKNPVFLRGNYYVRAWFQDERYFKNIRNILLQEFTPKKKIKISKELQQSLKYNESVALHVRRGDYVKIRNALRLSYFKQAVVKIKDYYKEPLFLVFSDDIEWVKRNLSIEGNCIYINEDGKLQDYEELLLMSKCSSNIISNSTFSWWGAWLNCNQRKIVIAPHGPWLSKQKNIIPKEWIVL